MAEPVYELYDDDPDDGGVKVAEFGYDLVNNIVVIRHEESGAEIHLDGTGLDVDTLLTDAVNGAVTSAEITDLEGPALAVASGALGVTAGGINTEEIADEAVTEPKLDALDTPGDGEVLSWSGPDSRFEWVAGSADGVAVPSGQAWADDGNLYNTVQDAINAATDLVVLGPGTFNEGAITISTAGLTVRGQGRATFLDMTNTSGTFVTIDGVDDVELRDFRISNAGSSDSTSTAIESINGAAKGLVKNITVDDSRFQGFHLGQGAGGEQWVVKDCIIETTVDDAIVVDGAHAHIEGNIVKDCFAAIVTAKAASPDAIITGNDIRDADQNGIDVGGDASQVSGNKVTFATASNGSGIFVQDSSTETLVEGNNVQLLGNGVDAIAVVADDVTIDGNTVRGAPDDGIVSTGLRAIITDNAISDCDEEMIDSAGHAHIIMGNLMRGPSAGNQYILSTGDRANISSNQFLGASTGINLDGANSLVTDNHFNNNGTDVDTTHATSPTVNNNIST